MWDEYLMESKLYQFETVLSLSLLLSVGSLDLAESMMMVQHYYSVFVLALLLLVLYWVIVLDCVLMKLDVTWG